MKRSAVITLLALGAGGVFLYSLAGEKRSDAPPEGGKAYTSLEQCETGGDISRADCAKSWNDALETHEKTAPKFTSIADCEKEYGEGKCTTPRSGAAGSYFPTMAAIMIGSMWLNRGYGAAPLTRRPGDQPGQFAFSGGRYAGAPSGGARGGGGWWSRASSSSASSGASSGSGAAVSTTSRGGFGSSGGGYSAGG